MLPFRWEELTAPEFNEAVEKSNGLCIVPIGCSERHGRHLAVGCDAVQEKAFADAAAAKEYAVVFPTGYWLGELSGLPRPDRRAITIEMGIQNSGLGLILLFNPNIFPPELQNGGMLIVTAWWGIWHIIAGLTAAGIFRLRDRFKWKEQ